MDIGVHVNKNLQNRETANCEETGTNKLAQIQPQRAGGFQNHLNLTGENLARAGTHKQSNAQPLLRNLNTLEGMI